MSRIAIIGATGYAGGHIQTEALSRGHEVIAVSRNGSDSETANVEVRRGSIEDSELLARLFADADVVIVAIRSTADGRPLLPAYVDQLLALAREHGTRLGFVGGAASTLVGAEGPRLFDTPEFPEAYKPEAGTHARVLELLRADDSDADWFYVSPGAVFGAHSPGERTGSYRVSDDVLLTDTDGNSSIGGADFATAIVDEIERPAHRRARFHVAY
ncbi:MAG TPA: NAD(P)H-binding protein [Solirubrobacteraceae bacterium]|nr:NAD(P)H-binding protein [Solirubrobacteraceae bacterium]